MFLLLLLLLPFIIVLISIAYFCYEEAEEKWICRKSAKNLNHLMEVEYEGTLKDIKRNFDMFCSFYTYLEKNLVFSENIDKPFKVSFKLKDNFVDKEQLCFEYLYKYSEDEDKVFNFIKDNYNIDFYFL